MIINALGIKSTPEVVNIDVGDIFNKDEEYLTIPEASALLKVPTCRFYKPEFRKQVPFIRMGRLIRYRKSDLVQYLENGLVLPETI